MALTIPKKKKLQFIVSDRIKVSKDLLNANKFKDVVKDFWAANPDFKDCKGCYILTKKPPKAGSEFPVYVGLATKGFGQEIFTDNKFKKYHQGVGHMAKSYGLYFYFVCSPVAKGPTNLKAIRELETFLISQAFAINPKLANDRGLGERSWSIKGVTYRPPGKPTTAEKNFKRAMQL